MRLLIIAAAIVCVSLTSPTQANPPNCGSHRMVSSLIEDRFEERRVGRGFTWNDTLFELWVSKTNTWSVLETDKEGVTCLRIGGFEWNMGRMPHQQDTRL